MGEVRDRIAEVLAQHPLVAGTDYSAGMVVCNGCRCVPGDPGRHLLKHLAAVLDPEPEPQPAPVGRREDPRESYTRWEKR